MIRLLKIFFLDNTNKAYNLPYNPQNSVQVNGPVVATLNTLMPSPTLKFS